MSIDVLNFCRCHCITFIADFEHIFTHKIYLLILFKVSKTLQLHYVNLVFLICAVNCAMTYVIR